MTAAAAAAEGRRHADRFAEAGKRSWDMEPGPCTAAQGSWESSYKDPDWGYDKGLGKVVVSSQ
jgi:hypothetical protein